MTPDPDEHARQLAREAISAGNSVSWFDELYTAASLGAAVVPWDRGAPHPLLVEWLEAGPWGDEPLRDARSAVVVGCGFGFDAELLAGRGFATVGFDFSPSAIRAAGARHVGSSVDYQVADLMQLPDAWSHAFDLVVEIMTVQSLPPELRARATSAVAGLVAPGGTLLVIAAALDEGGSAADGPPWPLTRRELSAFARGGLETALVEEIREPADTYRWRASFRRSRTPG